MSDASFAHCPLCKDPEYACQCGSTQDDRVMTWVQEYRDRVQGMEGPPEDVLRFGLLWVLLDAEEMGLSLEDIMERLQWLSDMGVPVT